MYLSDFCIIDADSLDQPITTSELVIVRCSDSEPILARVEQPSFSVASDLLSLVTDEPLSGTAPIPVAPLLRPLLELLRLGSKRDIEVAVRLWNVHPNPRIYTTWKAFVGSGGYHDTSLSPLWARKLVQQRLAVWDGQSVYVPFPVLVAMSIPEPDWSARVLHRTLQWIRWQLASAEREQPGLYRNFLASMMNPHLSGRELLIYKCIDLPTIASSNGSLPVIWLLPAARAFCTYFRSRDPETYDEVCKAQQPIWEAFGDSLQGLITVSENLKRTKSTIRMADYDTTAAGAREVLEYLATAYYELGSFERRMGVDRYMAPALIKADSDYLHQLVQQIRHEVNNQLEAHTTYFQHNWGNFLVADIVKRLFNQVPVDPFNSRFPTEQRTVVLLVLDGFGYVQYRWNRLMARDHRHMAFGGSVLDFISDQAEYSDTTILGSPLVSDTGAGMAQIFSGLPSRDNRIYSSHLLGEFGQPYDVKRINSQDEWERLIGGPHPLTFLDELEDVGINVFASGIGPNLGAFAKRNWGNHSVERVEPPERFPQAVLRHMLAHNDRRQLYVVYYPLIDRHGHSLGSFSSFELQEYEKLNHLLSSFILQLLASRPDFFDSTTTILITADHGMFESPSGAITLNDVLESFTQAGVARPKVIMANRAILVYRVRRENLDSTVTTLQELLKSKQMDVRFLVRGEEEYHNFFGSDDNAVPTWPDIVVLLRDNGLAVPRPISTPYLHYGGHGGCSAEEVFVPCVTIRLTPELRDMLSSVYGLFT